MRLFSFVASEPAKHELHGFVTHPQRQNSTQFRAQNVAKKTKKGPNIISETLQTWFFSFVASESAKHTSCIALWRIRNGKTQPNFVPKT